MEGLASGRGWGAALGGMGQISFGVGSEVGVLFLEDKSNFVKPHFSIVLIKI